MNPYTNPPAPRPWWKSTAAGLGMPVLVALLGATSFPLGFLALIAAVVALWKLPPWRWYARLGATVAALLLLTVGAGLGGQLDDGGGPSDAKARSERTKSPASSPASALPKPLKAADYTGEPLKKAEELARGAGFTTGHHDAARDDRPIVLRSGWTVCFQKADAAARTLDFAAVKTEEPCPDRDGGPIPWPTMPRVVGATYDSAVRKLEAAGIDLDRVELDDVYLDVDAPTAEEAAEDGDEWRVCFQSPGRGKEVTSTTTVRLDLGRWGDADLTRKCPSRKDTTYKIPANDPADAPDRDSDDGTGGSGSTGGTSSSPGGSTGGGSVGTVHPGSFCSPAGARGVTSAGTPMVCGPASDGRNRWHSG